MGLWDTIIYIVVILYLLLEILSIVLELFWLNAHKHTNILNNIETIYVKIVHPYFH